ncbi:MAG: ammonium transporter [Nitrospinota bacterium]
MTLAAASPAFGQEAPAKVDGADTAWLLASSALVMLMTPGLAIFYAGMVRRKNVLSTLMHCIFILGLVTVQWVVLGYSLAFGPDVGGVVGSLRWAFLSGVGLEPSGYAETVPHFAFMVFQLMFAIITPALIAGAFAERLRFSSFAVFTLLWATLVYDPIAHWVWGAGGWLAELGALDFAGGTVVHLSSGISALAFALVLGRRIGYPHEPMPPHNLPITVLGASLLWFGWYGFNAGSALTSGALSTLAFTTTHIAAAAAAFAWGVAEWAVHGKPSMLGVASGIVAGLVAITPAAGFVGPIAALIIGIAAGLVCYAACRAKRRFGYDDALDVFGIHAVGGALGALATGLFASTLWNPGGADGLFFGNPAQFGLQLVAVVATGLYAFVVSWILLKVIDATMGLRVSAEEEVGGLDLALHGETGYNL